MNKTVNRFSRVIAAVLIFTISYMFCSCPVNLPPEEDPPPRGPSPLTPGVGTPRYFYIDSDGNYIENEGDGSGRTGLIVEDNRFAEGVLICSDDTGTDDRVAFAYEDSIVSMSFKKDSNFPYSMNIKVDSEEYYAYVSKYNAVNHTYHVTFVSNSDFEMMDNVVLNENIFSLYENDPELSDSQNRRMANMIVAMGVWGSLYATFDSQLSGPPPIVLSRGIWGSVSKICKGVSKAFTAIAVAAAVVTIVAVPIVAFINPVAGMVLFGISVAVTVISLEISKQLEEIADYLEELDKENIQIPFIPLVYVSRVEPDGKEYPIKYNDNGAHEEFHIPVGEELIVKFYIPGFNNKTLPSMWHMFKPDSIVWFDEPEIPIKDNGTPDDIINLSLFEPQLPVLIIPKDKNDKNIEDTFFVKFKRVNPYNKVSDITKINFGFVFNFVNEENEPLGLVINENKYKGGFYFRKYYVDKEPILYKNMVVIYFCTKENCPDIPVEETAEP